MILIRRYYSNSKYQETPEQIKDRESNAAKGVAGMGLFGASIAAKNSIKKGINKLTGKYQSALINDTVTKAKAQEVLNKIYRKGVKPEDLGEATKFLNDTLNKRMLHNKFATNKLAVNGTKKIVKAVGRNAAKGAAIGGIIGAGLYRLNRKNLIKQNEEKNRRLAMRRERLAGKQKED